MKGTINIVVSAGGLSIEGLITRIASAALPPQEKSLPAADAGTLSTRTDATDGELTLEAGHGVSNADIIDIFWTDANGDQKCAYGATVGTVDGNDVPFTGASGDALPDQDTAITVDVQTVLDCDFDGDKALIICAQMKSYSGHVTFQDSGDAVLDAEVLLANEPYLFYTKSYLTNPLTGNPVDEVRVSNASSSADATFKLCGIYESDT